MRVETSYGHYINSRNVYNIVIAVSSSVTASRIVCVHREIKRIRELCNDFSATLFIYVNRLQFYVSTVVHRNPLSSRTGCNHHHHSHRDLCPLRSFGKITVTLIMAIDTNQPSSNPAGEQRQRTPSCSILYHSMRVCRL